MSRGGARKGAGRKAGTATKKTRAVANAVSETGMSPLEYMLSVMRDPKANKARRDEMAKTAGPYVHPRLSAVAHTGEGGGPIHTRAELTVYLPANGRDG